MFLCKYGRRCASRYYGLNPLSISDTPCIFIDKLSECYSKCGLKITGMPDMSGDTEDLMPPAFVFSGSGKVLRSIKNYVRNIKEGLNIVYYRRFSIKT